MKHLHQLDKGMIIMAFDGLFTHAMTHELQQIVSGRITKIHQPNSQELILHIRANSTNHKLLLSIHSSYARVQLTAHTIDNPPEPTMFCMLLRKHLEGGFIASVRQYEFDRIIIFEVHGTNELGDPVVRELHAEIMGRHSNILLIDPKENRIMESMKHLPPAVNSYRTILPGQPYIAPPAQNKVNPMLVKREDLTLFFAQDNLDAKLLASHFAGFSFLHAEEALARMQASSDAVASFQNYMHEFAVGGVAPTYIEVGNKILFSPNALTHIAQKGIVYDSTSALLDRVFFARAERDRVKQQAGDLERWLQNEINKLKLKMKKLNKDLTNAQKLDKYQLYGELLTANMYRFERGDTEVTVTNYYNDEEVTIPLSVRKTPVENAQSYYTKYNKAKNALVMVQGQLDKTTEDIAYFEMLMQQVQQASPNDIEEIRDELAEQGYMKKRRNAKKKKKPTQPKPEQYISSTGTVISVGKNNKQNDALTFKIARKGDTWLHTKDIPGSHVVIHSDNPDETTLFEAATLSAYFSKARESASVPVDYTEVRHVKKPNGAKPGFVIYFEQKTMYMNPDETLITKLQKKK